MITISDPEYFALDKINFCPPKFNDLNELNLKTLHQAIRNYLPSLKNSAELNIEAIAKGEDKVALLTFCEEVLAVAGNNKGRYIDAILQLDLETQGVLMGMMLKYLEEQNIDREIFESLQVQLIERTKEQELMIGHLKELEKENSNFSSTIDLLNREKAEIVEENQVLKRAIEGLRRISSINDFVQREKELEADIDDYKKEIKMLKTKLAEEESVKQQQVDKYNEELIELKERLKRVSILQLTNEEQKKKLQECQEYEEIIEKQQLRIISLKEDVSMLERRSKETESKSLTLMNEYYELKNSTARMEIEMGKLIEQCEEYKAERKNAEQRIKFLELKVQQAEETINQIQEEINNNDGLILQKESEYQIEIAQLQNQITQLTNMNEKRSEIAIAELKAKLEVNATEKEQLTKELNEIKQRKEVVEKDKEYLLVEIEKYKELKKEYKNVMSELNRIKKDKELLLDLSKRAQAALSEKEEIHTLNNKLKEELIEVKNSLNKCEAEKIKLDTELKEQYEKNVKLEKELIRREEQCVQLTERKVNCDRELEEQSKYIEIEITKKLSNTFNTTLEQTKKKYKTKIKRLKTQANELLRLNEILDNSQMSTIKQKENYANNNRVLKEKLQLEMKEREKAKKGIKEIIEANKRMEDWMLITISEISKIINQLTKDKHKGLTPISTQHLLNKLVDVTSLQPIN